MADNGNGADGNDMAGNAAPEFADIGAVIPAGKLDADQYAADDIDGVTESIFGSGNMAYASLQASQIDASLILNEDAGFEADVAPAAQNIPVTGAVMPEGTAGSSTGPQAGRQAVPIDTDRALDSGETAGAQNLGAEGNFTHTAVGALGTSALSSDAGSSAFSSGISMSGGNSTDNSTGGGTSVTATTSVANNIVNNIVNNTGDIVGDIVNTVENTINDITDLGGDTVENITNLAGDIIGDILQGDIGAIVNNIGDTISTEITDITETVNNVLQETGVTEIVDQVTSITNDITESVTNIVGDTLDGVLGGDLSVHLDGDALGTLGGVLDVGVDDSIAGNLDIDAVSDNLAALAGDLTGIDVSPLAGAGASVGFDLLGGADPDDGNDISVAGLDTPDISLDAVENVIGDIDIEVDAPGDLTDPDTLLEIIEDTVDSVGDLSLADPEDILGILGDEGGSGSLDIIAGDTELGQDIDTNADEILNTVSDSEDLSIDDSIALLSADGAGDDTGLTDGILDDVADAGWTESVVDAGGLFDDLASGVDSGGGDVLPDPSGTVAEGLGALNVDTDTQSGGLGGLFG